MKGMTKRKLIDEIHMVKHLLENLGNFIIDVCTKFKAKRCCFFI